MHTYTYALKERPGDITCKKFCFERNTRQRVLPFTAKSNSQVIVKLSLVRLSNSQVKFGKVK